MKTLILDKDKHLKFYKQMLKNIMDQYLAN